MTREQMLEAALRALLSRDQRNTCPHEETHRGGLIWEICDSCGSRWADDEGGKPEWTEPQEWVDAYAALAMPSTTQAVDVASWEAGRDAAAKHMVSRAKEIKASGHPTGFGISVIYASEAATIRALTTPAPWQPPPEAERPDGFECLGRVGVETLHVRWLNAPLRTGTDLFRGWFAVGELTRVYPSAFFPLTE